MNTPDLNLIPPNVRKLIMGLAGMIDEHPKLTERAFRKLPIGQIAAACGLTEQAAIDAGFELFLHQAICEVAATHPKGGCIRRVREYQQALEALRRASASGGKIDTLWPEELALGLTDDSLAIIRIATNKGDRFEYGWHVPETENLIFAIRPTAKELEPGALRTRLLDYAYSVFRPLSIAFSSGQDVYQSALAEGIPITSTDPKALRLWGKAISKALRSRSQSNKSSMSMIAQALAAERERQRRRLLPLSRRCSVRCCSTRRPSRRSPARSTLPI